MRDRISSIRVWLRAYPAAMRRCMRPKRLLQTAAVTAFIGMLGWFALPWCLTLPDSLLKEAPISPQLLDRRGVLLDAPPLPDFTRAQALRYEDIPPDLRAATIAAEDKRFFQHGGIDLCATLRAAYDGLRHQRVKSGASTITQQLIKVSSPDRPRTFRTKLHEALLARQIEMRWSKEQILAAYLERIDYGNNRRGAREAARFYFQKPLTDLSLAESALLAGLPQSPTRLNPLRHPGRAQNRRNTVLDRLARNGELPAERIEAARQEAVTLQPLQERQIAPWLRTLVGTRLPDQGTIRLTLDRDLQRDIEAIVRQELNQLQQANLHHAAVVIIDNQTGDILTLVSSGNWNDSRGGQLNGALIPRSPGSALKPFTYLLSLEQGGRFPGSILADIPSRFRTEEGLDTPENYDRKFRGPVSMRSSLACSLNVPAMRELNTLGGPRPLHELLTRAGLTSLGPKHDPWGLGLTLGNAPARLMELTNAYAALARGGVLLPVRMRFDDPVSSGNTRLCSEETAWLLADILSDNEARAPQFGRNGPLELPFRCAAKTGTSTDYRDNWCIGFTRDFTVGVWAGNFDNSPMKQLSGVAGAGPIFHRSMLRLHREHKPSWLPLPNGVVRITIDPRTGKRLTSATSPGISPQNEWCRFDRLPPVASSADYDSEGRALLDSSYAEWFARPETKRERNYAIRNDLPAAEPLRILAPRPDATYLLDPELPNGGKLRIATNLPGLAQWSSSTLTILPTTPEPTILLAPGTHQIEATDPRTKATQRLVIHVQSL